MKTEGWQFFQLSGKYDDFEDHKEAYKPFCKSIENIKRKQVEKEFPGKADVNKGKKEGKKSFNFEQELLKNLPQQYNNKLDESIESKNKIMDEKMDKLLDLFNSGQTTVQSTVQSGQQLASTIGNVKELLTSTEVEPKVTISENNPSKPKSKSTD
jgi:paraquat-inducible protein B